MDREYINTNVEINGIYKKEGDLETEDGRTIHWKNYYIEFTLESGLKARAKIDKVFNDYIEG